MTSVLGFTRGSGWDEMDGPQYYRVYLPLREVNRHDNGVSANVISNSAIVNVPDSELLGRNVYMMSRMYSDGYQAFIDKIHEGGGVFVLDSDDDLTETSRLVSGRGEEFKEVLSAADYVSVSTAPLADLFGKYTQRPPVVLKNCVDSEWMSGQAERSRRIVPGTTIGFSGSPTHWMDWYIASVPLQRIVREYDVVPIIHGEAPRYLNYVADESDMIKLGGVPFSLYPVLLAQFDILLCAVDSSDGFNLGKSGVKAIEAMCVGAVPICSRFGPYMELAENGAPVVIVKEDSRDGWFEAMRDLIEDSDRREFLSKAGLEWVKQYRDMNVSGHKQWADFYSEITD